ncbi:MerR family transcriptional regulator [Qaidamihabitans albus]|nr:MerR family transcriptional regulator [Qaidamihabitans albus]
MATMTEPGLRTSEVAEEAGVNAQTLRYYQRAACGPHCPLPLAQSAK